LKHAEGMQQLCVSERPWAVTHFRMGLCRRGAVHDARHGFTGARTLFSGIGPAPGNESEGRPYSWSTHDKMDAGVAESRVPQFMDLLQV